VPISAIVPGDLVAARLTRSSAWSKVLSVYRKQTILSSIPGRDLGGAASVTDNHILLEGQRPAGRSGLTPVRVSGPVFDLETESGNYFVGTFFGGALTEIHSAAVWRSTEQTRSPAR